MSLKAYELAKEMYASVGVDTDQALRKLDEIPVSLHCWQCDDVIGFENQDGTLTGGIQTTGNFMGRAATPDEMFSDLERAFSYIPGPKKINVHANYMITDRPVDRNEIEPEHFSAWADWACAHKCGADFNMTCFSHPKSDTGYTLSSCEQEIREFWIAHGIRTMRVAEYFGRRTGMTSTNNIWIPDGEKEMPIDTQIRRSYLKQALDTMLDAPIARAHHINAVESKLFGIGSESYVVGSHEFYTAYALGRKDVMLTLDTGHFHPTELVSNKLSALLLYVDKLLLHVSRPVRWDSDHVVMLDDETRAIMREVIRLDALDKVHIATDYFDASINRIMALTIGARNTKKALLEALLQPVEALKQLEYEGDLGRRLALTEELKAMPFGLVWDYYCEKQGVLTGTAWIADAKKYEREVLAMR